MIDIDSLTAKTILSDEVFEEIMAEEDLMAQARLIIALTAKAEDFGASIKKQFETLLKASKKMAIAKTKTQRPLSNGYEQVGMTDFDGKYPQMRCGAWIATENGVDGTNKLGISITACYHPILPIQRLINMETDKEKMKLAFKKGGRWKEIIVDKNTIANANKITNLSDLGVSVTSQIASNLVSYLSDVENYNLDLIPTQSSTSKLGWIGKEQFMPYSKEYVFDGENKFKDAFDSIHEHGKFEKWMDIALTARKSDRFEPKISMVASLASVLIKPLNALPFILNIYGDTGKGKTVSMMLAASIWANPAENVYLTDAKSTPTALELRCDFLNNLPMMIDDMSQVKQRSDGDFTGLVYMLCAGKGKDRANQGLGLNRPTTWKNIIMTNYEYSLVTETMQGGAVNRIIDVESQEGYIFENGNATVEVISNNYGFAGRMFIDAVSQIGIERIKEMQKQHYNDIVARAKEQGVEKEEKQILPMSILLTADKIATDYIFNDGIYLDFNTCVDLLKNKGEVSENERAYDFIMNELGINSQKFIPDAATGLYKGDIWGMLENGYAIINNNVFNAWCKKGNFSPKSFLSWAVKKGLLDASKDRNLKKKRLSGASTWCVWLKMSDDMVDSNGFVKVPEHEQGELPFE